MIILEYWQTAVVMTLFAYAIVYTTRKFYAKGLVRGYEVAIDTVADQQIDRALTYLAEIGVIQFEIDSDGEQVIVAGKALK